MTNGATINAKTKYLSLENDLSGRRPRNDIRYLNKVSASSEKKSLSHSTWRHRHSTCQQKSLREEIKQDKISYMIKYH